MHKTLYWEYHIVIICKYILNMQLNIYIIHNIGVFVEIELI